MATIAEKSRTKEIIERLQRLVETASPVPFAAGKISVYKEEIQSLLEELASQMDFELKTYHEVNDRKGKIINEAKKEAEQIIFQAEHSASRMRVSKRATNVAPLNYDLLDEEERRSLENADEIYAASLIYTDEMLTEVTEVISDAYKNIRSDYEIVMQVLEEKLKVINDNKEELMNGLKEMETEDRGQQILEIGQLLSNELYNEKMKHRMPEDSYEDGSVQLTLDFQKMQEELTKQAEQRAQQAEQRAQQAEQDILAMQTERDNLLAVIGQMQERENQRRWEEKLAASEALQRQEESRALASREAAASAEPVTSPDAEEEDVEYEIVYVTEDELEDGEEYEIEYVDEFDEEWEEAEEDLEEEAALDGGGKEENTSGGERQTASPGNGDTGVLPVLPRFKMPQKVASAPAEKIARMASAVTKDERYSGLIGGALGQEPAQKAESLKSEPARKAEDSKPEPVQKAENPKPEPAQRAENLKLEPARKAENPKPEPAQSMEKRNSETKSSGRTEAPKPESKVSKGKEKTESAQGTEGGKPEVKSAPGRETGKPVSGGNTDKTESLQERKNGEAAFTPEPKSGGEAPKPVPHTKNEKPEAKGFSDKAEKEPVQEKEKEKPDRKDAGKPEKRPKDEDVRTDADGKEYVQAKMVLEEEFEIMEF